MRIKDIVINACIVAVIIKMMNITNDNKKINAYKEAVSISCLDHKAALDEAAKKISYQESLRALSKNSSMDLELSILYDQYGRISAYMLMNNCIES